MTIALALLPPLALAEEPAPASVVVVWTQAELPPEDELRRVEKTTGPAKHLVWGDVAFDRQPFAASDTAALTGVATAVKTAQTRWDEFDIETTLAMELHGAVERVGVLRDDADRAALVSALLLEGAAALRIVPEAQFGISPVLAPLREKVVTSFAPSSLVDVLALDPARVWTRADLANASTLLRIQALQAEVRAAPAALLQLEALPGGATLLLDGRPIGAGQAELVLSPGRHYVHTVVNEGICGRMELDAEPGTSFRYGPRVSTQELEEARTKVLAGSIAVPEDLGALVEIAAAGAPTYLAALNEKGNPSVLAWRNGAAIEKVNPFAVLLGGQMGPGLIISPGFSDVEGINTLAPAFTGDLGLEFGIWNAAVYGGSTLELTPTQRMKYANADFTANVETNVYFRPYGGVGVYLPRPQANKPLFLLGGNYGWMSPGAMGFGARASIGLPAREGASWLRFTVDGFRGVQMTGFPAEGEVVWGGALRIGFGRKL